MILFLYIHSCSIFNAADVSSRGTGSSCPSFLQPFRGPFRRGTPDPRPGLRVGPPAGPGRPRARAGPGQSSGGTCCGPDRTCGRRAWLRPSRLSGAGRAGPGCTWTRPGFRWFRRQAEAAAGLPGFGWPVWVKTGTPGGSVLLPRPTHLRPRRTAWRRPAAGKCPSRLYTGTLFCPQISFPTSEDLNFN